MTGRELDLLAEIVVAFNAVIEEAPAGVERAVLDLAKAYRPTQLSLGAGGRS